MYEGSCAVLEAAIRGSFLPIKVTLQADDGRSLDGWMSVEDAGELMRDLKSALTQLQAEVVRLGTQPQKTVPQTVLTDGDPHSACRFLEIDQISGEEGAAEWAVKGGLAVQKGLLRLGGSHRLSRSVED